VDITERHRTARRIKRPQHQQPQPQNSPQPQEPHWPH
jgi:hypothetical protein